jgi:hypothetical protein
MDRLARRLALLLALLVSAAVLAGCATGQSSQSRKRDMLLRSYASAIRWSEFEQAWGFLSPQLRESTPLTDLELERFKQVQVVGYTELSRDVGDDGSISQRVEIRLVNRHTQVERVVIDKQRWSYDPEAKRWWLESGLPDFAAAH